MDNMKMSPKYRMSLVKEVCQTLWKEYITYKDVLFYIDQWHENHYDWNNHWENFAIVFKDSDNKDIDLERTLHGMKDELVLKIAIDLGIDTPDFIPSIPTFRNAIKSSYTTASVTFEKAFKCVETEVDTAIGLANSALESIIKEILKDERIKTQWKEGDTLYKLTQSILKEFKYFPNDEMPQEIKTIGHSLLSLSKSIEELRSTKTRFHGKTDDDYIITNPLYAYFVINSISTIGLFLISYYKEKYPKKNLPKPIETDDVDYMPF